MSKGQRTGDGNGQYGSYRVTRTLVRAPGMWLAEGLDQVRGDRVILQLARCKPATDPEAKRDRQEYVRLVDTATRKLAIDPDVDLIEHAATEEADGSVTLYWVLPWIEGAEDVGRINVKSSDQLSSFAITLLERLEAWHVRNRLAPTLTEQVLTLAHGQLRAIGLPIHLPTGWLTSDLPSPRLAPEERDRAEPRASGDVWRVGRTLRALGAHLTDWPDGLKQAVDRMDAETLSARFSSAHAALLEVEAIQATFAGPRPVLDEPAGPPPRADTHVHPNPDTIMDMSAALRAQNRHRAESGAGESKEHADPAPAGVRRLLDGPAAGREAATVRVELSASDRRSLFGPGGPEPGGEPYGETLLDQPRPKLPSEPSDTDRTLHNVSVPALPLGNAEAAGPKEAAGRRSAWDKADADAPPPTKPVGPKGTVVGVRLINEPTGLRNPNDPEVPAMLPPPQIIGPGPDLGGGELGSPPPGMLPPPQAPGAPVPGPGAAPMLPGPQLAGPSPMTVPATGVRPPAMPPGSAPSPHPSYPQMQVPAGPAGAGSYPESAFVPGVSPMGPAAAMAPGSADASVSYPNLVRPAPDGPLAAPPADRAAGSNVLLGIVIFVAGVATAFALQVLLRTNGESGELGVNLRQEIQPAGEVLLQAMPAEAVVVSESDGQILGTTPMRFLVPAASDYAVLVAAKGHEPVRLTLPSRGRLRTDLVPLDTRPPCVIALTAPDDETLEGVGADVEPGRDYIIRGAAVLRSPSGAGAWLVRCPALGGTSEVTLEARPPSSTHRLSILAPPDATVSINGERVGKVPFSGDIKAQFVLVRTETLAAGASERWIPLFASTRVKMPKPIPAAEPR